MKETNFKKTEAPILLIEYLRAVESIMPTLSGSCRNSETRIEHITMSLVKNISAPRWDVIELDDDNGYTSFQSNLKPLNYALKMANISWAVVVHDFNPRTRGEAEACRSL